MDKILLNGLVLFGHHGHLPAERELSQPFRVSVELALDLREAGRTDDMTKTVDWATAYHEIRAIVEGQSFDLTEALAEEIATAMLAHDRVREVKVRVEKTHPPIPGPLESFAIEIVRKRSDA